MVVVKVLKVVVVIDDVGSSDDCKGSERDRTGNGEHGDTIRA